MFWGVILILGIVALVLMGIAANKSSAKEVQARQEAESRPPDAFDGILQMQERIAYRDAFLRAWVMKARAGYAHDIPAEIRNDVIAHANGHPLSQAASDWIINVYRARQRTGA